MRAMFYALLLLGMTLVLNATSVQVPHDFPTIRDAVNAAELDDQIELIILDATIIFNLQTDIELNDVSQSLRIAGSSALNRVVVTTPDGIGRAFANWDSGGLLTFENILFSDHTAAESVFTGKGGAIYCANRDVSINNCAFENNTAPHFGGAIYVENAHLICTSSKFDDNHALTPNSGEGGAIYGTANALSEITECSFVNNSASYGGGSIYNGSNIQSRIQGSEFRNSYAQFGAAIHVSDPALISDCDFISNVASLSGSAIFASGQYSSAPTPLVFIEDCFFTMNYAEEGGTVANFYSNSYIRDCEFTENAGESGVAIESYYAGNTVVENCEVWNNTTGEGGALISGVGFLIGDEDPLIVNMTIRNSLFHHNDIINPGAHIHGIVLGHYCNLSIESCSIVDNTSEIGINLNAGIALIASSLYLRGTIVSSNQYMRAISMSEDSGRQSSITDISFSDLYANTIGNWDGWQEIQQFSGINDNTGVDPAFVNPVEGDYRLKWNSPLIDKGDAEAELDFDLTRADVGFQGVIPVLQISGVVNEHLEAQNYEVTGNCTITGMIRPGATIRTNTGVVLEIQVPNADALYTLGDINGPRTAIVGRPTKDSESAASIEFVARTVSSPLAFEGVLFNFPAVSNDVGELRFNGQYAPQNYTVSLDGNKVDFMNYSGFRQSTSTSPLLDAHLAFWYSRGTVSDVDFRLNEGDPANLQLFNSAMTIADCEFKPTTTSGVAYTSPLQVFGMMGGETSHMLRNTFHGDGQQGPLAHVTQSVQRVRRNQFLDCRTTALRQDFATMDLSQEGRNSFFADAEFLTEMPMVTMDDGDLDLYCGRNNFVVRAANEDWPIITYIQRFYPGLTHRNWKQNFFGRMTCDGSIPDQELLEDELLPAWVVLESSLSECVPDTAPEDPRCENPTVTSYQLLKDGINAETAQDYETARGNYFYLLALYPDSKETNEATLRLKALGLSEDFGSVNYEAIRGDLHSVADSSEAVPQHSLAVLQVASGWCVEAMYGDRPNAISSLEAAYAAESDSKCRNILSLALAEIATYPVQGGVSATGPEVRYARALVQQSAVQALFALQLAETTGADPAVSGVMPQTFAIERIYPNPFNPTTTIELSLPTEGLLRLQVYNLLGQSVDTVVEERLEAGLHVIRFDGSSLASGMYLAVAEFEGHSQVRKMLLMK